MPYFNFFQFSVLVLNFIKCHDFQKKKKRKKLPSTTIKRQNHDKVKNVLIIYNNFNFALKNLSNQKFFTKKTQTNKKHVSHLFLFSLIPISFTDSCRVTVGLFYIQSTYCNLNSYFSFSFLFSISVTFLCNVQRDTEYTGNMQF